jgi:beta-glucosidase
MTRVAFPPRFVWGAATAAYQVEGAIAEDGRGESIWDRFTHSPGTTADGETGDVACDHYHRLNPDLDLFKELGLKGYRFSIAWPRIFPEGKGRANPKGVDFYHRLVDGLLERGIEPYATIYHWDLPQALEDRGGWGSREVVDRYVDYAAFLFEALGGKIKKWITHNEPWVVAFLGHSSGQHAPGKKDGPLAVQGSHHLMLSHARAVQAFRQISKAGEIGITLISTLSQPASDTPEDRAAALRYDGHFVRWFFDPVLKGSYPEDMLRLYQSKLKSPQIEPGDMEQIARARVDFVGLNYYTRSVVRSAPGSSFLECDFVRPKGQYTEMDWEVYPDGLYDMLVRLDREYGKPRIVITENGAAFKDDRRIGETVQDEDRIQFLKAHFAAARRAIRDGVRLDGYFVWSVMDNFEWALGFTKRFGVVHVDYETLRRTWKKSAFWLRDVIQENGFEE